VAKSVDDWRELLRRYILYVQAREGADLLDRDSPSAWDERIKLRRLAGDATSWKVYGNGDERRHLRRYLFAS
jgi:hypothetical protein